MDRTLSRPAFKRPMLALSADRLPTGPDWWYEVKVDGVRAVAIKQGGKVRLYSRKPREIGAEYPTVVQALSKLSAPDLAVDGEIVALDANGRSSFQLLQNLRRGGEARLFYVLFDVTHWAGADVTSRPLHSRRKLLRQILPRTRPPLRLSPLLKGSPDRIWSEVQRLGLEGIIAKRKDSPYQAGGRGGAWLKIKSNQEQEFVIGGYTQPRGGRQFFGAILVGYDAGAELRFASAVGTGFDTARLSSMHRRFQKLRRAECPFSNLPASRRGRWGGGLTAAEMKRCVWVKPTLVGQVRFHEWTRDGNLRQPVFLGLREDKHPREVVRESV